MCNREYTFSIIIPVYNAELYLGEMIESVISQTYSKWELIIIDDGSTDLSSHICDSYVDDRISVYHYSNNGQMYARIEGIKKAHGDYTLVVDADDKITLDCLEIINGILNQNEYDAITFPLIECDEKLNSLNKVSYGEEMKGEKCQREVIEWVINTWSHGLVNKVFKTELIKKGAIEATFKRLRINGDYALIIPILCHINSMYFLTKPMYFYRIYGKSISHNYCIQHIYDTDYVTDNIITILEKHNLFDDKFKKMIYNVYFNMILWLLRELKKSNKLNRNELLDFSQSEFLKRSKEYETLVGLKLKNRIKFWFIRKNYYIYV